MFSVQVGNQKKNPRKISGFCGKLFSFQDGKQHLCPLTT